LKNLDTHIKGKKMGNVQDTLFKLMAEQLGKPISAITLESTFEDLGADSLDVVEIALTVEDKYEIEIPDDAAEGIDTVGDIIAIVEKLIKK
jgi:acyl carrier protein